MNDNQENHQDDGNVRGVKIVLVFRGTNYTKIFINNNKEAGEEDAQVVIDGDGEAEQTADAGKNPANSLNRSILASG